MLKRITGNIGKKSGSLGDLALYSKIMSEATVQIPIFRGVNSEVYNPELPGRYWTNDKNRAEYFAGDKGFLLQTRIPFLDKRNPWVVNDLYYCFPELIVDRFFIRYYVIDKKANSKFF